MNIFQRAVKRFFFSKEQKNLLELYNHGYLYEHGYVESIKKGEVVFFDGSPAPWLSYPFLDFFIPKLKSSFSLFEFGLGNSTLYYKDKLESQYGVESDNLWYDKLLEKGINGSNFINANGSDYVKSISSFGRKFDVIIIDGILRDECLIQSLGFLELSGILILDDSEREEYVKPIKYVQDRGFKKLDFYGMKAFGRHKSSTSVFYRPNNCLNI